VDLKTIEGKEYIVHQVTTKCSLVMISLKYNVPEQTIRYANGMAGDQIFAKKEVLIPVTPTTNIVAQKPMDAAEKAKEKADIDKYAINMVAAYIKGIENPRGDKRDHMGEAKYYLEVNAYDMVKARENYLADVEFEKSQSV